MLRALVPTLRELTPGEGGDNKQVNALMSRVDTEKENSQEDNKDESERDGGGGTASSKEVKSEWILIRRMVLKNR